jgi:UDP-N-acetylmuramoyl-L-alanyl-D-glutamate--2,6-diaminopimelate ligase
MRLDTVVAGAGLGALGLLVEVRGDPSADVVAVTHDSRHVGPGVLFACVPGEHADGHLFAPSAAQAGAAALLCERPLDVPLPQVVVQSTRAALGPVADVVYGHPSGDLTVVGVTGTNGKTTTCELLSAVFASNGWASAALGTLTQARTTPEAPELQARLAALRRAGARGVAMEVSSHALDQHRVDAVRFAAGVLTNVTQDHLDYHRTMEAYFAAKARLFEPGRVGVAVVNRDDPWGRRLLARVERDGVPAVSFGADDASKVRLGSHGSTFVWNGVEVALRLGGRFNVLNALAAATCASALGVDAATVARGLAEVSSVRGRFEPVDAGQPFTVLVDYAHTPDGLTQALTAARELASGRVLVVFGAGGDRDHAKRPLMGAAANAVADLAVVTSDNPRSENPRSIIDQILSGVSDASKVVVEPDRARAIATALAAASPGDVVVVAGKGHELGQEIGGQVLPFDDAAEARAALTHVLAAPHSGARDSR